MKLQPTQALLAFLLFSGGAAHADTPAAQTAPAPRSPADPLSALTRGLQSQPGFIDIWRDVDKGRVLLSVAQLDQPFLLATSLPYALGSNDVGLDRAQRS